MRLAPVLVALALSCVPLVSSTASAQELTLEQASALLDSSSPDEVRMGIESMGLLGSPGAVAPLTARIRRGLPPELLLTAIDTLGILGRNEAGPILFELVTHRRPEVRLRAVQAIATCRPRGADTALVTALSDSSPAVRSAAAQTLGELRASGALESLFLAFDHEVLEAGPAIAAVARGEDVPRILAYVGHHPFTTLRPMLLTLMTRADLPAARRLEAVARVSELATPEARALLEEVVNALAANDPVRRSATDAMNRISL
ncbi:MAG: HEAT repeat domain-containing protein [Sandaracinaceae bacterium]|nr:HEAT repeat domain-containing protein [Sandaracinaceae bacterium]